MLAIMWCTQNTILNTDKLLLAAGELAQTGECNPGEIYGEARALEDQMNAFLVRVERQRHLLDSTVTFYTHAREVRASYMRARGEGFKHVSLWLGAYTQAREVRASHM